jgi:hypothetical protein
MADQPLYAQPIPNLIQGASQQSPLQRRDTQCEEQYDCLNSPVEDAIPRPGFNLSRLAASLDLSEAFFQEIGRNGTERYLVAVTDGDLMVFDLEDGTECTVTFPDGKGYLGTGSVLAKDAFCGASIDDYYFLANKTVLPAMDVTTSPSRPKEALVHFRAGQYLATYQLAITYNGNVYTWAYTSPDNSVAANAKFIATNQLAATFARALTGSAQTPTTSGTSSGSAAAGVGPVDAGQTTGMVGAITATSLGFSVALSGNVIRIWRNDGVDFKIDASDGAGNNQIIAIKDEARSFATLPSTAFNGFTVKVKGDSKSKADDYYVTYRSSGSADGVWEETVAPATLTTLDPDTMPWALVNTAYRTFVFQKNTWGTRIAGDETSAKDPSFVGRKIQDIFADTGKRLGILTPSGPVYSKARDPFTYFADTVQTVLADAPVDLEVASAVLEMVVQASENTFLWSQGGQYRVSSAANEVFKQDTAEAKISTKYKFASKARPLSVAQSLLFAAEPGRFVKIRDLFLVDGRPRGEQDITEHVPKYIPTGVRVIAGSDTLGLGLVLSEGSPTNLYAYNWKFDGNARVQSAWNTWRLPAGGTILWVGLDDSTVNVVVQRSDGVAFLTMDAAPKVTDPGGDYLTRLDYRVDENQVLKAFDAGTNITTITLPYTTHADDPDTFEVVVRTSDPSGLKRGRAFKILSRTGAEVEVEGDATGYELYAGFRFSAERIEEGFYLRSEQGVKIADALTVSEIIVSVSETAYTRAEVIKPNGAVDSYLWTGRIIGSQTNLLDEVAIASGPFKIPINSAHDGYKLRLVNDSYLPSRWQAQEVRYRVVLRAVTPRRLQ